MHHRVVVHHHHVAALEKKRQPVFRRAGDFVEQVKRLDILRVERQIHLALPTGDETAEAGEPARLVPVAANPVASEAPGEKVVSLDSFRKK